MDLITSPTTDGSWWRRPAGGREVLQVALPLVVSALSWTVMTYIDRAFLNRVSSATMSAAFSASVIWFALLCLPLGICCYANTFVSQYHGDRQPHRIGPSVWQAVWAAVLATPLVLAAVPLAPWLFEIVGHGPESAQQEILYFQILCTGGPAMLIAAALASFYSGRGKTWVVMVVDAFVTMVNLILDYLWIFGYGGFPELGIAGAGWATVIALWLKVAVYLVLVMKRQHRAPFQMVAGMRFDRKLFNRLLYFGGPSGMQMLLDVAGWSVFVVLVGRRGEVEAAATTLAFSIGTIAFMPVWGFGMAVSILVGQHLGENRDDLAARATWTSLQVSMAYMAVVSALYVFTPSLFLQGFFSADDAPTAEREAVWEMAVYLLCFIAAYNVMDALFQIFVSAVKGAGDTQFVMRVSLVMTVLLAGLSWLTIEVLKLSIYGCWTVATAWVFAMGVIFLLRFLGGKWRTMRVIEPHEVEEG